MSFQKLSILPAQLHHGNNPAPTMLSASTQQLHLHLSGSAPVKKMTWGSKLKMQPVCNANHLHRSPYHPDLIAGKKGVNHIYKRPMRTAADPASRNFENSLPFSTLVNRESRTRNRYPAQCVHDAGRKQK